MIKNNLFRIVIWSIALVIAAAVLIAYWEYAKIFPSTDDAYIHANIVHIAPQVSGPIASVAVENNQKVSKGQLLLTIDPQPFEIAVANAKARLALAKQTVEAEQAAVATANAQVARAKAEYDVASENVPRTLKLVSEGKAAEAEGSSARGQLESAQAALQAAQAKLQEAKSRLGEAGAENATIQQAQANLNQAKLNLSYTKIYAPADGAITKFNLRPGTMVQQGQSLFALIESKVWWVDANYKETDLERIHTGQKASIKIDIYPGVTFHGYVQSISLGSGSAFALLPPENATGNWVKVTQRFPVKVIITNPPRDYPLRVGASADVTVDTHS